MRKREIEEEKLCITGFNFPSFPIHEKIGQRFELNSITKKNGKIN